MAATSFAGTLHVFYEDVTNGDVRHAWFNGMRWRREVFAEPSSAAPDPAVDIGAIATTVHDGILHVVYQDGARGDLHHATFDGGAWASSVLDGEAGAPGTTDHDVANGVELDVWGGRLHALYGECDPAYDCSIGWARDSVWDGDTWSIERAFRMATPHAPQLAVIGRNEVVAGVMQPDVFCGPCETPTNFTMFRWAAGSWSFDQTVISAEVFHLESTGADAVAAVWSFFGDFYFTWSDGVLTDEPGAPGIPIGSIRVGDGVWFFWAVFRDGRYQLGVTRGP